ncbi:MAG: ATP-dependent Clp protease proteolytic subunit [Patescibacteria group bacterium]|nr:ATP-dependent Clp protease proteolytic subunit [Patescibacteria group bacterium]
MTNQLVPIVVEKDPRGFERSYDIYSRLLKERIIFLTDVIDMITANTVIAQLLFLQYEDSKKEIKIYINSPGGSAYAGLAVYDTIQHLKCPVSTIAVGMAASAAALILAGGVKGKRYSLGNSVIMIHQPHGGAQGQATDIEISAKEYLRVKDIYIDILAKHCGQKREKVAMDVDRDFFMSPGAAKNYGIIDDIIA